mmetsp:Transcript_32399/g.56066  ORF Transcript_32399/g.56066 Transcript_32399/m.56066 type:complete len:199 (-) Transcript_32399:3120-3716(-)
MSRYSDLVTNWVKNPSNKLPTISNTTKHNSKVFEFNFGNDLNQLEQILDKRGSEGTLTKPSFLHTSILPFPKYNLARPYRKLSKVDTRHWNIKSIGLKGKTNIHKKSMSMNSSATQMGFLPAKLPRKASMHIEAFEESSTKANKIHSYVPSSHVFSKLNTRISLKKLEPAEFLTYSNTTKHKRCSSSTQTDDLDMGGL